MTRKLLLPLCASLLAVLAVLLGAVPAMAAAPRPTSAVLVPYFEVDLETSSATTLFAVANALGQAVAVDVEVHSNWGIPVLTFSMTLDPYQVRTMNLRDWLAAGNLPGRTLDAAERAHVAAALSGLASPKDGLYYATPMAPGRAVGYVTLRTQGIERPDALWGDWFAVDPGQGVASGDVLVDIAPNSHCPGVCKHHALRFLNGGAFDGGTDVVIWTPREGRPSANPDYPALSSIYEESIAYDEPGRRTDERELHTLPVGLVKVKDMGLATPFGWLDVHTDEESYIGMRYGANGRYSVALQAACLPENQAPGPGLHLEKLTNGVHTPQPPGRSIPVGASVLWEYVVTNIGGVPLADVAVSDDRGVAVDCPRDTLAPAESMTCTGHGVAAACQYVNVGTATASPPSGPPVVAEDTSHYFGAADAAIDLETAVNGQDADSSPGPEVASGAEVHWTYVVRNTGAAPLTGIAVGEDHGLALSCPKTALAPGESMTCTGTGAAGTAGTHASVGTASGATPCGPRVSDSDPGYYHVGTPPPPPPPPPAPRIDIEKLTNGDDADAAPGPSITVGSAVVWTYVVTNRGDVPLTSVHVTDDRGVAVTCPKTSLAPAESMTCTGQGTAVAGQYVNIGTATGTPPSGPTVADEDPSHYYGQAPPTHPQIAIEKRTNGEDADAAPGPTITVGAAVLWTYMVTNRGDVALSGIQVTDNRGVSVTCPKTSLAIGESMTCTGKGTAVAGQYENIGTATGTPPSGPPVTDQDPSHYYGQNPPTHPQIDIEKLTNGQDADAAPGPTITVGAAVLWTYVVTNRGDVALSSIHVTDNRGVTVTCPKTSLVVGESMTCTGKGTAVAGQYENIGTATGTPPSGSAVTDTDPSHYYGQAPSHPQIDIEKLTNGQDADAAPGPTITVGAAVLWTYVVTNRGDVALSSIHVTDNRGVSVTCPKTTLAVGESMTCTGKGTAVAGQYENIGTATGTPPSGSAVTDTDPSHYYGQAPSHPQIDIEKLTNGQDADNAPGPTITVGAAVLWTYVVTNRGDVALSSIQVTDDRGVTVTCPKTSLAVGESMTCTGKGTAVAGQYENTGTAKGTPPSGPQVADKDLSHYYGQLPPGDEGCSPGYWKNHTSSWSSTGYSTSQKIQSVFSGATAYSSLGNSTLLQGLAFQGGSNLEGAAMTLLRSAVAAVLNAAHSGIDYPRSKTAVIADVNASLASANRDNMLNLASALDHDNNLGCPLGSY